MATLRLVPEDGGKTHEITQQALIGRDASCDVVISHGSVSRRHARLEQREGGWAVVDQASANGTFLDGQRVADVGLRQGHKLRIGAVTFEVELEGGEALDGAKTVQAAQAFPEHLIPPEARHIGLPTEAIPAVPDVPPAPRPATPPPPPPVRGAAPRAAPAALPVGGTVPAGRSGRGPLFWIAGGCLGCLGTTLLALATLLGGLYYFTQPPVDAVRVQLAALQSGQIEAVYEALDDSYREKVSLSDFIAFVSRHPTLLRHEDSTFWTRSFDERRARIGGTLTGTGGEEEDASFHLVRRSGVWRITLIAVEGDEAP